MDPLKEAFGRIKEEINELRGELSMLYSEISSVRTELAGTKEVSSTHIPTQTTPVSIMSNTQLDKPTHILTQNLPIEPQKAQNQLFSSGNEGVPTDRQTHEQTGISTGIVDNPAQMPDLVKDSNTHETEFEYANKIIDSLDEVKKQIRCKFKQLTPQEWAVFSLLYSLEEQGLGEITYKTLANHLKLSESSIRDYVNRLLIKGIPLEKTRLNNKTILLSISSNLKKIVTLPTLMRLREL